MGMGLGTLGSRFGRLGNAPSKGVGVPAWASGTDLWTDFTVPRGTLSDPTDTHASTIYAPNAAGVYAPFAANVLTRTDLGLQTVPTRTNLCTYSNDQTNAAWINYWAGPTSRARNIMAPDGTVTATRLVLPVNPGTQPPGIANIITGNVGSTGVTGVWMKGAVGGEQVFIGYDDVVGGQNVNLTTNWALYQTSGVVGAGGSRVTIRNPSTSVSVTIDVWQAQHEIASFTSAPILTSGTSVTVNGNQQVIDLTGRLGTGVAGIVQVDIKDTGADFRRILNFSRNVDNQNELRLYYVASASGLVAEVTDAGASQGQVALGSWPTGIRTFAFAYAANFFTFQMVGGAALTADTSATYPSAMTSLAIGGQGYGTTQNCYQVTRKLALSFGPQDATTFAAMFARAEIAAVS
jgi:hypothetical protein